MSAKEFREHFWALDDWSKGLLFLILVLLILAILQFFWQPLGWQPRMGMHMQFMGFSWFNWTLGLLIALLIVFWIWQWLKQEKPQSKKGTYLAPKIVNRVVLAIKAGLIFGC